MYRKLINPFAAALLGLSCAGAYAQAPEATAAPTGTETAAEKSEPASAATTAAPAASSDTPRVGAFGVGIGTNGIGLDYARRINNYLDVRVGYDFGSLNRNGEEEGIDYSGKLKFSAARFLADIRPFGGGFRITAGLYTGAPELTLRAEGQSDEPTEIGDSEYNFDGLLRGKVDLGSTAPYVGLGWGGSASTRGFGFSNEIGVLFTGAPGVDLNVVRGRFCDASADENCDPNAAGSFEVNDGSLQSTQLLAEVEAERAELEDDTKDFKMWPILRFTIHYRF